MTAFTAVAWIDPDGSVTLVATEPEPKPEPTISEWDTQHAAIRITEAVRGWMWRQYRAGPGSYSTTRHGIVLRMPASLNAWRVWRHHEDRFFDTFDGGTTPAVPYITDLHPGDYCPRNWR